MGGFHAWHYMQKGIQFMHMHMDEHSSHVCRYKTALLKDDNAIESITNKDAWRPSTLLLSFYPSTPVRGFQIPSFSTIQFSLLT